MKPDLSSSLTAAPALLGWKLVHESSEGLTSGYIVETEAYSQEDPASHTYGGKKLANAAMFEPAGTIYVYFTYGMHYCVNIVTGPKDHGQGVLIRALQPLDGIELMAQRRGIVVDSGASEALHLSAQVSFSERNAPSRTVGTVKGVSQQKTGLGAKSFGGVSGSARKQAKALQSLCSGPGKLVQAMGITKLHGGTNINDGSLKLERGITPPGIVQTTRVGISKAVDQPWRFYIKDNPFVSKR